MYTGSFRRKSNDFVENRAFQTGSAKPYVAPVLLVGVLADQTSKSWAFLRAVEPRMLVPGYLFVAASESLLRVTTDFQFQEIGDAFVYVKDHSTNR